MNSGTDTWKIIHIPHKPPDPPNQQPTVNAVASVIEPKFANALIRNLNKIAPLENLRHIKRIRKRDIEGKNQLSVILCLASENDNQSTSMPQDVQELINSYQSANMLQHLEKSGKNNANFGQRLFIHLPKDSQAAFNFMKMALDLAKSGDGPVVNAAFIVDPSVQQIIASGCDQIFSSHIYTNNSHIGSRDFKRPTVSPNSDVANDIVMVANNSHDIPERLDFYVSCLNPWQWSWQQLNGISSFYCRPLRHAPIVAIECSAERDRLMFPGTSHIGEKSLEAEFMQSSSAGSLAKRQKTDCGKVEDGKELDSHSEGTRARPYLCTSYDIYMVWEPCIMCAMALVHQRIRRIFFAFPNPNAGALGSVQRLQGEKSLNHHYAVFRVILPEEVLGKAEAATRIGDAASERITPAPC